ncbi:hypothetical protein NPIL_634681 [Nephila pilipes]|uniref:Uncharacterized protein n=1 Tax=Nephila pilipes TaxID=299642 RepID=A0A8X6QMZ8_NEPPI|nr:hypothetical protein NPIL_634681 [Nephila pilipes]
MKDDLNQFTNLCQSWGIQNPATQTPFVLAKPRQRKNSLPGETSKKQKLEATTCQNKFSVLYIEDPPEELQIDEPLPPSPTPEKTTTKPKKKHGPSKKPASLANKQPPAPTPVITAAQIAQPKAVLLPIAAVMAAFAKFSKPIFREVMNLRTFTVTFSLH